jgi:hypothetical protein
MAKPRIELPNGSAPEQDERKPTGTITIEFYDDAPPQWRGSGGINSVVGVFMLEKIKMLLLQNQITQEIAESMRQAQSQIQPASASMLPKNP